MNRHFCDGVTTPQYVNDPELTKEDGGKLMSHTSCADVGFPIMVLLNADAKVVNSNAVD